VIRKHLVTWEGAGGWIYHWFICGFFEAGLRHDPSPSLFDEKRADNWTVDLLGPWGGETGVRHVPSPAGESTACLEWLPVSQVFGPRLSLSELRTRYEEVDAALGDLDPRDSRWNRIWYALALIEAEEETPVTVRFCGWDGCRLLVNGSPVFDEHSYHHVILDKEEITVTLPRGTNSLLFKLDRDGLAARVIPAEKAAGRLRVLTPEESPRRNRISTEEQLKFWAMEKRTEEPFTGTTEAELRRWQRSFREFYRERLGPFPPVPPGDTACVETETTPEGVERRLYHMPSEAGCILPFYVLLPPEKRRNNRVVIVAHGHNMQWKTVAGVTPPPSPRASAVGPVTADYAYQLACRGFVTAVCCERGFAERNDHRGPGDKCTHAFMLAMAQGFFYPALHMHDIRRMTSFVMSLPETAGMKGPGITGLSGGGTLSYLLAAYDETFAACAVWCGICRYRDYATGAGCGMQVVPRLWPRGDVGEVLSLIAPRPLLVGQGRLDATFNVITVASVARDAERAYRAAGRPENLRVCFPDLAHQVDVETCAGFFEEVL